MNPLIRKELNKLSVPFVEIDGSRYRVEDIPETSTSIIIKKISDTKTAQYLLGTEYHFVFDTEMVKPRDLSFHHKWNQGIPVPLIMMDGIIEEELSSLLLLNVRGSLVRGDFCKHCLRFSPASILCSSCREKLGIMVDEDILNIKWRGWVPRERIKEIQEI